jgi:hypothetical protein
MTTFVLLSVLLLVGLSVAGLVRELRRDPAHHAPCSHPDAFAPRWREGGPSRWAV